MSSHLSFGHNSAAFSVLLALVLFFLAYRYLRGWLLLRSNSSSVIQLWRAAGFFLGLILIWTACGSPLAAYDHSLLTFHMIKHLLLMTVGPALILLGKHPRETRRSKTSGRRLRFRSDSGPC